MQQMTEEEYVARKGLYCPYCASDDIDTGADDFKDEMVVMNCVCYCCDKEWTDEYKLAGYSPMEG